MERQRRGGEMQPVNERMSLGIHNSCKVGTVLGGVDL